MLFFIFVLVALGLITYFFGFLIAFTALLALVILLIFTDIGRRKEKVYSVEVGKRAENETIPRRSIDSKELTSGAPENCETLYETFQHGLKCADNGKGSCFGTRSTIVKDGVETRGEYEWESYNKICERFTNLGSGLVNIGMKKGSRLGIYSENKAEWMIAAEAANAYSFVTVSIYDTLGIEHRAFIINQSEIHTLIIKYAHLKNIFALSGECPELKNIVVIEPKVSAEDKSKAKELNLSIFTFAEVEKLGAENPHKHNPPTKKDLAVIMYTSGTTSRPKGVLLSHENITSVISGVEFSIVPITSKDTYFSYLPLAHILERAAEAFFIYHGARIGFYQGDIRKFPEDVRVLKPTMFAGVPKVFQRVQNTIMDTVNKKGFVAKVVFNVGFYIKRLSFEYGFPSHLVDKIVFAKVREALGGQIRVMLTGGAPCSRDCHEFMRICMGVPLMQGYGSTETCGGSSLTPPYMIRPYRKAGAPLSCCEIKLLSAGSYSVSSSPPRGEICISGPSVSQGYYKMPDKTKEDFRTHADGKTWFHTGDVGEWNADGTLSIVGRVKDIFKLDTGEYIAPERLETIYAGCSLLSSIFVYGESDKSFLIAVVVPEVNAATEWARANAVKEPEKKEPADEVKPPNVPMWLCREAKLKEEILKRLKAIAENAKLNRYEQVVDVYVDGTFWTPDTGLVTDALKNKRFVLDKHYAQQLKQTYASGAKRFTG